MIQEVENRSLLPRQGHPLAKPIWDVRLQATWITYTGIYVIVGTAFLPHHKAITRMVSSGFLTAAGLLVLLLMCHTVIAADKSASRKTLLVALTACLFFVQKSYDTYHDANGLVFAIIFSAMILTVVWLPDDSRVRDRIMLTSIAVLLAAITFSALQLAATLIEQRILRWQNLPPQALVVSPHVAGILSGMMSFLVLDGYVANSANRMRLSRSEFPERFFLFFGSAMAAIMFTYFANELRFTPNFLDTGPGVVFTAAYVIVQIAGILAGVWIVCSRKFKYNILRLSLLVVLALALGVPLAALHHAVGAPSALSNPFRTYLFFYCVPMVTLVLASAFCSKALMALCDHLYERATPKKDQEAPPLLRAASA